jgi:hypothetical protein
VVRSLAAALALALPLVAQAQAPLPPAHAGARPPEGERGLLVWYPLDGDAVDAISRARAAAVAVRPADDRDGRRGGALAFDGVRSHVNLGDRLEPGRFTVSAWIRPDATDRTMAIVSKIKNLPGHWSKNLELRLEAGGRLFLHVPSGAAWDAVQGTRPIPAGRWTHVAAVYDGARAQLFVDGVRDGAPLATPYAQSRTETFVGARPESGGRDGRTPSGPTFHFLGAIDDVRVHDRPLADAEIASLAGRGGPPPGLPPGPPPGHHPPAPPPGDDDPIAWFPLDGDAEDAAGGPPGAVVGDVRPAEDRQGDPRGAMAFGGRAHVDLGPRVEPETLTLAAWVRPTKLDREGVIVSKLSPAARAPRDRWLELRLEPGGRVTFVVPGVRSQLVRSTRPLAVGRWAHVAATFDGERATLYVDGVPEAEAALLPFDAARGPAFLGARPEAGGKRAKLGSGLQGRLDDVRLYRGALSDRDVRDLADERRRPGPPRGDDDRRDRDDDASPLVRVGRLLTAYDAAVSARDARRIARAEERIADGLAELEADARAARAAPAVVQRLRRAAAELEAQRGRLDALSLDRKRAALTGLAEALWDDLAHDLDERPIR